MSYMVLAVGLVLILIGVLSVAETNSRGGVRMEWVFVLAAGVILLVAALQ